MKRFKHRILFVFSLLVVAGLFAMTVATINAATIFESGTLGPTGLTFDDFGGATAPSGSGVNPIVFSGVRFELSQPVLTTRVGGHFVIKPNAEDSFFGAIVQLDSVTDFPNSGDLSTTDVLGKTLLTFPESSTDVFGDLTLSLNPGWYALIFGSGLFGATGSGGAVLNNPDIGSPSYIGFVPGVSGWIEVAPPFGPFENYRLVIEGTIVPEPNTLTLGTALLAMTFLMRLHRFAAKSHV